MWFLIYNTIWLAAPASHSHSFQWKHEGRYNTGWKVRAVNQIGLQSLESQDVVHISPYSGKAFVKSFWNTQWLAGKLHVCPTTHIFLFLKKDWLIWKTELEIKIKKQRGRERERIFHLRVHFPNCFNNQGWAKLKPGIWSPTWMAGDDCYLTKEGYNNEIELK